MRDVATWLGDNTVQLIGLLATLGLLAVTFWYAKTTKDMATIAKDAASESARATEAAERSAQAALDTARVAQSRIVVKFKGRMIGLRSANDDLIPTVEIRSVADSVVVQRVRVRRAYREKPEGGLHDKPSLEDDELTPVGETVLPTRLHEDERLHFTHPAMQEIADRMARFILDIGYTFSEDGGAGGTRELLVTESDR